MTKYKNLKYTIIQNNNTKEDQRAKNLNLGIENAKVKYLSFLDDDEFVENQKV